MTAHKRREPSAESSAAQSRCDGPAKITAAAPTPQARAFLVVVDADLPRIWRECDTLAEAVAACAYLRGYVPARVLVLRSAGSAELDELAKHWNSRRPK